MKLKFLESIQDFWIETGILRMKWGFLEWY